MFSQEKKKNCLHITLFSHICLVLKQVSFSKGDILNVIEKSTTDWWWVEINGCHGYAPVNHFCLSSYQLQAWEDEEYFGQYGDLVGRM